MPSTANEALVEAGPDGSSGSNVIEFPFRNTYIGGDSLHEIVFELATAADFESAIARLVESLQGCADVSRVEWWRTGDDGAPELVAAAGSPRARRHNLPLGPAGVLVLHGGRFDAEVESALLSLAPILRRRAAEEQLTRTAMRLARRNEELEDFAALVAHELKAPLQAALVADNPSRPVEDALELVDALLQAAQNETSERTFAPVADALDRAVQDLRSGIEITPALTTALPLPSGPLRVILRNLLSNAVAAGARHVHVTADRSSGSFRLLVEDDGAGLVGVDRYASGSGLGFTLCRRIATRFGGRLQLVPRPSGGACALLEFVEAPR
jgi:signal transduction histidine kinase